MCAVMPAVADQCSEMPAHRVDGSHMHRSEINEVPACRCQPGLRKLLIANPSWLLPLRSQLGAFARSNRSPFPPAQASQDADQHLVRQLLEAWANSCRRGSKESSVPPARGHGNLSWRQR